MQKKCMKCQKPATYKFVKIENNQIYDMFFCAEHATEMSPYLKHKMPPLSEILANILQEQAAQGGEEAVGEGLKCKNCGLPFESYRKTLFLGCSDCYESFFEALLPDLRKFHGAIKHIGRMPGGGKESPSSIILPPVKPAMLAAPPSPTPEQEAEIAGGGEIDEAPAAKDPVEELAELNAELKKAIAAEDFELAAKLRDQIAQLRETLKK